jgi:hypothetical protein
MLQITPQVRILVAIEAVDGRNYALPNNMWSSRGNHQNSGLCVGRLGVELCIT